MQSRQVFKEKNMPRKVKPSKRYLALRKKISDAKLLAAKQSVTRPEQALISRFTQKTNSIVQRFTVVAQLVVDTETFLAQVPIFVKTVPEVPEIVTLDGSVFVLTNTSPLTYVRRISTEATRI
jgi:hypothetical protein